MDLKDESIESQVDALFDQVVGGAVQIAAELKLITEECASQKPEQNPLLVREDEPGYFPKTPSEPTPQPSVPPKAQAPSDP